MDHIHIYITRVIPSLNSTSFSNNFLYLRVLRTVRVKSHVRSVERCPFKIMQYVLLIHTSTFYWHGAGNIYGAMIFLLSGNLGLVRLLVPTCSLYYYLLRYLYEFHFRRFKYTIVQIEMSHLTPILISFCPTI